MPTHTLARAERFAFHSNSTGRDYEISMARAITPPDVKPSNCPILLMLDGALTFGTAVESASLRTTLGQLQPAVIVGVGYDADLLTMVRLRTKDLTSPTADGKHRDLAPLIGTEYGGAEGFLNFIIDELVPTIRMRAPEASPTRIALFGHSLAGLFTIYALMKRPDAFETFVANSPSLWWNDFAILHLLPQFKDRVQALPSRPRVMISVGGLEQQVPTVAPPGIDLKDFQERVRSARMVDAARDLATTLQEGGLCPAQFVCFDNEEHGSVVAAAVARCIRFSLARQAASIAAT
jgi:predicted alpha/beta superfamily hydrolase